jgi:hypothetical protein
MRTGATNKKKRPVRHDVNCSALFKALNPLGDFFI